MTESTHRSDVFTVLSVDLAARRYIDNGIAILRGTPGDVRAQLVPVASLGLSDTPDPIAMADALVRLAVAEGAGLIVIDETRAVTVGSEAGVTVGGRMMITMTSLPADALAISLLMSSWVIGWLRQRTRLGGGSTDRRRAWCAHRG